MTFKWERMRYVRLADKEGTIIGSFFRLDGTKMAAMETKDGTIFVAHEGRFVETVKIVEKYKFKDTTTETVSEGAKHTVVRSSLVPK